MSDHGYTDLRDSSMGTLHAFLEDAGTHRGRLIAITTDDARALAEAMNDRDETAESDLRNVREILQAVAKGIGCEDGDHIVDTAHALRARASKAEHERICLQARIQDALLELRKHETANAIRILERALGCP